MAPSVHSIAHVLCTVILTCVAYHYLQIKSQQSTHMQESPSKDGLQTPAPATDSVPTINYPDYRIFDDVKSSENSATLVKPTPVSTSYRLPPMPSKGVPSENLQIITSKMERILHSERSKYSESEIQASTGIGGQTPVLGVSVSTTVTSMTVQEVHPQFNWNNEGAGGGQCGGNCYGGGGDECGGPGPGDCGGGPPQGQCGGPGPGGGGPPQGQCGGPGPGGGGPPQGQCGGPGPGGNPGHGQCGAPGLFGGPPPGGDRNMLPSESFKPQSSTEFTTSVAASLRDGLHTDPDDFTMTGVGLKPLSNDIVTKVEENTKDDLYEKGSSVWCSGTSHTNRLCHFRNLCYISSFDDFVFFHSKHSTIFGVPNNRFSPALLDLSTIEDHNTQYFNYVDLPISALEKFDVAISKTKTLMFNRFYTENVMHVLHDDLIPAFHTLLMITNGDTDAIRDIQLLFSDNLDDGDFLKLYKTLSHHGLYTRKSLREQKRNICFQDIHVGLSKGTLWYQYGYRRPQGPVPNYKSAPGIMRKFTDFFQEKLKPQQPEFMSQFMGNYFVLLSRKETRRIINEGDLIMGIANRFQIQIRTLSLEDNKVGEIIDVLGHAKGAIGMHGSLLSLAMFMPPGSVLLELFPYAVNPSNYTPFRTMARIPGVDLVYKFWRNRNKTRTFTHVDNAPEFGGIKHLSREIQDKILQDIDVPPHLCCKDPHWLFRAYQDTRVNIKTILKLIDSGKNESEKYKTPHSNKSISAGLHAGKIQSLVCKPVEERGNLTLTVSWDVPWNLKYFEKIDLNVKFEVWIQVAGEETYKAWIVEGTQHSFSGFKPGVDHLVWVRVILGEKNGPFNDAFICGGANEE